MLVECFVPDGPFLAYRVSQKDIAALKRLTQETVENTPGLNVKPLRFLMAAGGVTEIPGMGLIDIELGGLYRGFNTDANAGIQFVVHDGDVFTLAASLSLLFYNQPNEPDDPSLPMEERRNLMLNYVFDVAPTGKVGVTCLTAANAFATSCAAFDMMTILWEFKNLSTQFSSFASHAMTEVYLAEEDRWVLLDVDRGAYFHRGDNGALSCDEFLECGETGETIHVTYLTNKRYAGFGRGERVKIQMDFVSELYELGGTPFDKDFYQIIAQSEIVTGVSVHRDKRLLTTEQSKNRSKKLYQARNGDFSEWEANLIDVVGKFQTEYPETGAVSS